MKIEKKEFEKEKEYLQRVKETLNKIIEQSESSVTSRKNNLNELKRFMWDNLPAYTDEERAIAMYEMDRDVDITNKSIDIISKYKKALQSPYFAKLLFRRENADIQFPVYIGMTTIQETGLNCLVYDWRSPISSMFYNFEVGEASYEAPIGVVSGEILEKMQFKIVDGKIIRCFKSDINIDDDYLQEILASSSSQNMKNIVSTIQREQNLVIRNNIDKCIIVQGIAGSGKTSVALHRIAYLLYCNKDLTSNNILVFSPNDVFSEYISSVLPELGEQNVLKTTFSDFAQSFLKPNHNIENYSEFLERSYNISKCDDTISYKMSDSFKNDIDDFIESYEENLEITSGFTYNNIVIKKGEIEELLKKKYKKFPMNERIDLIAGEICGRLKFPKKYKAKIIKQLLQFSGVELNYMRLYKTFLNSNNYKGKDRSFSNKRIKYEDIAGLVYFNFIINGYPTYNHIRQIAIDEAQDYSKFQIMLIKNIFKNASFTILGDVNQSINPHYKYGSLKELADIFNNGKYIELTKSYRSSQEIVDYSNKILGINNLCSVRHANNVPILFVDAVADDLVSNVVENVLDMQNKGFHRVAIITKTVNEAQNIYDNILKTYDSSFRIQLVSKSDSIIDCSTIIIPSYLSKGLEFDGVIAYNDPDDSYTLKEKNLYYVVCTRAQHQLNIYNEPVKILKKD